jgi:hypothetical protein
VNGLLLSQDNIPGFVPGHEEAYSDRQLAWLIETRKRLRRESLWGKR